MGLQRVRHDWATFTSLHYAEVRALQGVGFVWESNSSFKTGIVLAYTCHSDIIIDKASSHSQKCSSLDDILYGQPIHMIKSLTQFLNFFIVWPQAVLPTLSFLLVLYPPETWNYLPWKSHALLYLYILAQIVLSVWTICTSSAFSHNDFFIHS